MVFKLLNHFGKKKEPTKSLPIARMPWNEFIKERYDKELDSYDQILRVVYSDDKTARAIIYQRPDKDMLYAVSFEKLHQCDDFELQYTSEGDSQGYWCGNSSTNSFFETEELAANAIFSEAPFRYNRHVVWKDEIFRIDVDNLHWIGNDGKDDPNDLCLHGHVFVKIGDEFFEYDATVSAAGLYLLRSLTENHTIHENQAIIPCCGGFFIPSEDLSSVSIVGCSGSNGVDWSVVHEEGKIKLVTETGKETLVNLYNYYEEIYAFLDMIESFYKNSSPKNVSKLDQLEQNGYIAFWNEWNRRRFGIVS